MENGTSILFGLPGVGVQRVERATGEDGTAVRLVHVVATASSAAGCPQCGVVSTSLKQWRTTRPRNLPYGEEPLAVRWQKRQYRCQEAACPRTAFTEGIAEIPAQAPLTGRLCRQLASQVASGRSVSAVAAQYQVSWPVTHRRTASWIFQSLPRSDQDARTITVMSMRHGRDAYQSPEAPTGQLPARRPCSVAGSGGYA
jgi:transposase